MRKLGRFEPMLGRAEIGGIQIDVKSRDDIPAILLGLQGLYLNEAVREAVFELLLDRFGEDRDLKVGRPGMELWTVLVLAVLKQGLGCDFDRLREHAVVFRIRSEWLSRINPIGVGQAFPRSSGFIGAISFRRGFFFPGRRVVVRGGFQPCGIVGRFGLGIRLPDRDRCVRRVCLRVL